MLVQYGVRQADALIDFDEVLSLAREHHPKLIIAGGSAYPRKIDFAKFREIADEVGCFIFWLIWLILLVLLQEIFIQSPFPHAHIVTSTTHKTLERTTRWSYFN